jgi:hypothetical protein
MNDEQTPPSGSRWELAPAQDGIAAPTEWLLTDTLSADAGGDGDQGARTRRPRRGRAVMVGAGLALVLGGSAGGFALGRAIAGDGGTVVPTSATDGQRPGLDGRQLDGGRLGDPGGDDDHGRFGTPPGGTAPDGTAPDGTAQEGGTQGSTT